MEIPATKEQEITSLVSDLEKLSPSSIEPDSEYTYIGVFSNDLHVAEQIPFLQRDLKVLTNQSDLKVGLVVASGGILSLGKELPEIDLWILLDKSPGLIEMMKKYFHVVSNAKTPQQVLDSASDFGGGEKWKIESTEMQSYGEYHYLNSQENLERTQQFLKDKKVILMNANLLDKQLMDSLGDALNSHNAQISFANFTNVMEWVPGYEDHTSSDTFQSALGQVPFSPECAVLFSVSGGRSVGGLRWRVGRSPLITDHVVGFQNYLEASNS